LILYCAADLIWATRIKRTGEAIGIACRPVKSLEKLEARLSESHPSALVVDLEAEAALELIGALRRAEAGGPERARVLAFGPHIRKDLLQAARDTGADDVLPRGAFDRELPEILLSLAGRA
jgi:hypothetical protein